MRTHRLFPFFLAAVAVGGVAAARPDPSVGPSGATASLAMTQLADASLIPATAPGAGRAVPAALASLRSAVPVPTTTTTTTTTTTVTTTTVTTTTVPPAPVVHVAAPVAPPSRPAPTPPPVPAPAPPAPGVWAELRQCESGGNYAEDTGNGYFGAYQFALATWEGLGYTGLPSDAPPAVQDAAAQHLQALRGWGQWPACSVKLGL